MHTGGSTDPCSTQHKFVSNSLNLHIMYNHLQFHVHCLKHHTISNRMPWGPHRGRHEHFFIHSMGRHTTQQRHYQALVT